MGVVLVGGNVGIGAPITVELPLIDRSALSPV
jgi:hypothetical protein